MSIPTDGVPTKEELEKIIPPEKVLAKGPRVIVECFQHIPCDPCAAGCPSGAIRPFEDINDLPLVDYSKCIGCGKCIASCPGLAIFVVDINYSATKALIKLPYESIPLPNKGQIICGLDREGQKIANVRVAQVLTTKNKTNIITVIVPRELAMIIRSIRVEDNQDGR